LQQKEQAWKHLIKTEKDNLIREFQQRDWNLGPSATADQINAENQWRQTRIADSDRKLVQIRTQKTQSLQSQLDEFLRLPAK
jgi:hypothetical protein